jgi:hypothetical protein
MNISHVSPIIPQLLPLLIPCPTQTPEAELWNTLAKGDPTFLAELRREGLAPLVYSQLLRQGRSGGGGLAVLSVLQHDYYCSVQAAVLQEQQAFQVLQAFNEAGVELILLKGANLRLRVYQDPAQRPMSDLDILISRDQLLLAQEVLACLGYLRPPLMVDSLHGFRELFEHELLFMPSSGEGLAIDLHWEIRAVASFYRLPFPVLRDRAIGADYQGLPVKLLSPEHLLIHLCLHMYGDLYDHRATYYDSRQIVDLALTLTRLQLDWSQFLKDAAQFNCQAPVLFVFREMSNILPQVINPEVLSELGRYRPKAAERILLSRRLGYLSNYFATFYRNPCRYWLYYLSSKLWPSQEYLTQSLSMSSRISYLKQFLRKLHKGPN